MNQGGSLYEDLSNGLPLLFETIFTSQNPVPKLIALYKNGREICSGPIGIQIAFHIMIKTKLESGFRKHAWLHTVQVVLQTRSASDVIKRTRSRRQIYGRRTGGSHSAGDAKASA